MSNIKFPVLAFVFLFSGVLLAERGGILYPQLAETLVDVDHEL